MPEKPAFEISMEARKQAVASIQRYFKEELEQPIGDLKSGLLLDYFVAEMGPIIYNQAIADARDFLAARFIDLSADMSSIYEQTEFPYWEQRWTSRHSAVKRKSLNEP
jgi:uncharacterized protein (DUF2164 family)